MGYNLYQDEDDHLTISAFLESVGPDVIAHPEIANFISRFSLPSTGTYQQAYFENCDIIRQEVGPAIAELFKILWMHESIFLGGGVGTHPIETVQAAYYHIGKWWEAKQKGAHDKDLDLGEPEPENKGDISDYADKLNKYKRRRDALNAKKLFIKNQEVVMRQAFIEADLNLEKFKQAWKKYIKELREDYKKEKSIPADEWPG